MSSLSAELLKLKNSQKHLERSDILERCLSKYSNKANISEYATDLVNKRKKEHLKIENSVRNTYDDLNKKKELIKSGNILNVSIEDLKESLLQFHDKINNIKQESQTRLKILGDEQKNLENDLEFYKRKVNDWNKPLKKFDIKPSVTTKINTNSGLKKEVKDFLQFVHASKGHENGWSVDDHQLFLKIRNKTKNLPELIHNLQNILPDLTNEEIEKHENWFRKYESLKKNRDDALIKWKQEKNENINKKTVELNKNRSSSKMKTIQSDPLAQQKLMLWKIKKEQEKQKKLEIEREKIKKQKIMDVKKFRINMEIRETVENWKQRKIEDDKRKKLEKQIEEYKNKKYRGYEANKMLKLYQIQDNRYIDKMKKIKQISEEKPKKVKSNTNNIKREPDRVLQPTKQWLNRIFDVKLDNKSPTTFISNIQKLGVPTWRMNVTPIH